MNSANTGKCYNKTGHITCSKISLKQRTLVAKFVMRAATALVLVVPLLAYLLNQFSLGKQPNEKLAHYDHVGTPNSI